MEEIELSIMSRGPAASDLRPLFHQFETQRHCSVRVRELVWETAWTDLVKVALYGVGPDVSEIGTTWIGNLVAMNGLRPFGASELASMGGESAFFRASWQSGRLAGDTQMWAIPWLADTRLIHFRRDWLEKAKVDEQTAFQTATQLDQMLERLKASDVTVPWVTPTVHTPNILHNLASWVWSAGGDFASADGKRILFNQPQAQAGIRAHFNLRCYLPSSTHHLSVSQSDTLFQRGEAAVTMSGPWLIVRALLQPDVLAHTGIALPLGNPFVGGSNLVVWRHSRHPELAVELVRFLTSQQAQATCCQHAGLLPVRQDTLNTSFFAEQPYYQAMTQALQVGRSFPSFSMWGLVEDGLITGLAEIWSDVLTDPNVDLDVTIVKHLDSLARRLSLKLTQT